GNVGQGDIRNWPTVDRRWIAEQVRFLGLQSLRRGLIDRGHVLGDELGRRLQVLHLVAGVVVLLRRRRPRPSSQEQQRTSQKQYSLRHLCPPFGKCVLPILTT